jgi:hypothetical protein
MSPTLRALSGGGLRRWSAGCQRGYGMGDDNALHCYCHTQECICHILQTGEQATGSFIERPGK